MYSLIVITLGSQVLPGLWETLFVDLLGFIVVNLPERLHKALTKQVKSTLNLPSLVHGVGT